MRQLEVNEGAWQADVQNEHSPKGKGSSWFESPKSSQVPFRPCFLEEDQEDDHQSVKHDWLFIESLMENVQHYLDLRNRGILTYLCPPQPSLSQSIFPLVSWSFLQAHITEINLSDLIHFRFKCCYSSSLIAPKHFSSKAHFLKPHSVRTNVGVTDFA